jgi:hypothetical protein
VVPVANAPAQETAEERQEERADGDGDANEASASEIPNRGGKAVEQIPDAVGDPRGQEAAKDPCGQGQDQDRDKTPYEQQSPVATAVEAGQATGHVPAEEKGQENQESQQDEAGDDGGPDLAASEVWREA